MPGFRGRTHLYLFQAFNSLSFWIILRSPIVLLTAWLGGGSQAVGIVTSIMPFLTVMQIPSTRYIARFGYRRVMLAGWTARTMIILGIVVLPFFKGIWPSRVLVLLLSCFIFCWSFFRGMANAAWLPWIKALVPEDQRGRYFAGQHRYIQLMGLLIFFLSGVILGKHPGAVHFSLIYGISFIAAMISLRFLSLVPSVRIPERERVGSPLLSEVKNILRVSNYRRFLVYAGLWTIANGGFEAFTVLYLKRETGIPEQEILWLGAAGAAAMIFILFFCGHFLDRWGSRPIMLLCLLGTMVYQGLWFCLTRGMFRPVFFNLVFLYFLYGIVRATIWIANWRLTLHAVPREKTLVALAVYTTGVGLLGGITPLVWGFLLARLPGDVISPFGWFFLTEIALNFLAFLVLRMVREESAEKTWNVALAILLFPMRSLSELMSFRWKNIQALKNDSPQEGSCPEEAETRAENRES